VPFARTTLAQLPPATIADEDFSTLLDELGRPVDDAWKARRRDALLEPVPSHRPGVVLLELFPFGRRQFRFELLPLLDLIHSRDSRPRVVCSVRDILVAKPDAKREAEVVATIRRYFDAVLVHGDPALIGLQATFPAADRIADLIRYSGYVGLPAPAVPFSATKDEVIVSAGGGAVGEALLFAALAARPLSPLRGHLWRLLTGPNLPAATFDRLARKAGQRTVIERFRPDFPALLHGAALSISQAGYNTTMDILQAPVPAVVIPYERQPRPSSACAPTFVPQRGS
jgi:predicted glycosyltransferase